MLFVIIHFYIKFNIYRSKIVARRLGSVKTVKIEICFSCFADSFVIPKVGQDVDILATGSQVFISAG